MAKFNVLEAADTPRKLIAIDLRDDKNLLSRDNMGIGIGAVSELAKAKCSDLQKLEFKMQFDILVDTLVVFSKSVTMLVIFNVKQQFYGISIIFTCPSYWKSQGISHGLESGHPEFRRQTDLKDRLMSLLSLSMR